MRFRRRRRTRRRICFLCDVFAAEGDSSPLLSARVAKSEVPKSRMLPSVIVEFGVYLSVQDINDSRMESDVDRIHDHTNRRKSITRQDVSSTARAWWKKKKKKNAMRFLLSHRVCARAFFFYTVSLVNRWICSCQVSLYCHKSMCSVLVIVPWSLMPCSFDRSNPPLVS